MKSVIELLLRANYWTKKLRQLTKPPYYSATYNLGVLLGIYTMKPAIKKIAFVALALAGLGVGISAQGQELRSDHPDEYVVQRGDTLWDISTVFLNEPWLWPEIWHVNTQIANPHLIYPGDRLRLVYIDGQPRISLDRGVVRLQPQIRSLSHEEAISSVPVEELADFFSRSRVISKAELEAAPYMIAGPEGRILVGANDRFYARGTFLNDVRFYQVFSPGEEYVDPDTDEVLGVQAQIKGLARYQSTRGEVTTLGLEESYREISIGDVLLPLEEEVFDGSIFPEVPGFAVNGQIIAIEDGVLKAGQFDIVAINRGENHGLDVGHLLSIWERGETIKDRKVGDKVVLPDEEVAMMMVVKTFDKMSFGLVLQSERPVSVGYKVNDEF